MFKSSSAFGSTVEDSPKIDRAHGEKQTLNWIKGSPDVIAQIRQEIAHPTGRPLSIRLPPHIQKTFLVENGELSLVGLMPALSLANAGIVVLPPEDLDRCLKAATPQKAVAPATAVA